MRTRTLRLGKRQFRALGQLDIESIQRHRDETIEAAQANQFDGALFAELVSRSVEGFFPKRSR